MNQKQILLAAAVALVAARAAADTTITITGATAFRSIAFDRAKSILTSPMTVTNLSGDSNARTFIGTIAGSPGLGTVTIQMAFSGSAAGMLAVRDQSAVKPLSLTGLTYAPGTTTGAALAASGVPAQAAFSDAFPETAGIDGSVFNQSIVGVTPFIFFKSALNTAPGVLGTTSTTGVTNLTQRQVAQIMSGAGTLPTRFLTGNAANTDPVYLVGRDSLSGTRIVTDACVYFADTPANYTTNSLGQPILHPAGGHASGSKVVPDVVNIPNAIGYAGPADALSPSAAPIAYEGVPFSELNVARGAYPVWGYEHVVYRASAPGVPSADQKTVLNKLIAAIQSNAYQTDATKDYFKSGFVPLSAMEVERTADGGPITPLY